MKGPTRSVCDSAAETPPPQRAWQQEQDNNSNNKDKWRDKLKSSIRTALLASEEHTCPTCHQADASPANKFLRQAVNNFRNGTGCTKRPRKQVRQHQQQQPPPPPPPPPLMTVTPPAALVTAAELSKSSSLSVSRLLEEKGYRVPVLRQPALPSLLGPQGQSVPTAGHATRARTVRSAGGRPGCEL
ncbi:E3 ubiquitin-protein ligase RBBP6-like [Theristicus caerulescens]